MPRDEKNPEVVTFRLQDPFRSYWGGNKEVEVPFAEIDTSPNMGPRASNAVIGLVNSIKPQKRRDALAMLLFSGKGENEGEYALPLKNVFSRTKKGFLPLQGFEAVHSGDEISLLFILPSETPLRIRTPVSVHTD